MALNPGEVFSGGQVRDASGRIVVAVDPSSSFGTPVEIVILSPSGATSAGTTTALSAGINAYPQRNSGRASLLPVDLTNVTQAQLVMNVETYSTPLSIAATGGFNTTNGQLTVTAHGLSTGSPVSLHGTLPAAFTADLVTYFVTAVDANTLTFSATSGGSAIVPATAGSSIVVAPVALALQFFMAGTATWFDGSDGTTGVPASPVVALPAATAGGACSGPWFSLPAGAKGVNTIRVVSFNPTATTTANPVVANLHLRVK